MSQVRRPRPSLMSGPIPASHALRPLRTPFRHPLTFHGGLTGKDGWSWGSRRHLLLPFPLCPIPTRPTPLNQSGPNPFPGTGANAVYCAISDPYASCLVGGERPSRHPFTSNPHMDVASVGVTEDDWAPFTPVRLCRTGALRHPFTTPRRIASRRTGYHDRLLSSRTI